MVVHAVLRERFSCGYSRKYGEKPGIFVNLAVSMLPPSKNQ